MLTNTAITIMLVIFTLYGLCVIISLIVNLYTLSKRKNYQQIETSALPIKTESRKEVEASMQALKEKAERDRQERLELLFKK